MKHFLTATLISTALVAVIFSCATVPKGPLGAGEVGLLNLNAPNMGNLDTAVAHGIIINFEADGTPEITRACFQFSGYNLECVDLEQKYVTYGSRANFRVYLHPRRGLRRLDCYAEYIRNGETQRTNTVSSYINGYEVR